MRNTTIKTVRGAGAIKKGFVQFSGSSVLVSGSSVSLVRPLVPLMGALFTCRVGHSPRVLVA